ncbi:MAG: hypothetical protein JXA30_08365 [Deltaproteobacteria bacterium]|nr:hypothetical protein [Deltaproteobacteria bacterium]
MVWLVDNDSRREKSRYLLVSSIALFLGCWENWETPPHGGSGDNTMTNGGDETIIATKNENTGSACLYNNLTQPCTCINGDTPIPGRQTCDLYSGWSDCECSTVSGRAYGYEVGAYNPTANKGSEVFRWQKTLPSFGSCKAGHYLGAFTGFYNSPAMGAFDVSFSPVGIPVLGTVAFDLRQVGTGEYFEIENGAMEGLALFVFPFRGDLIGRFDCTGDEPLLEIGLKNGTYNVVGTNYFFDGKSVALYNKENATFNAGQWAVTEPEDYSVVVRNDDGTADLTKAIYAPLPELTPGVPPFIDMFVEGGTGQWLAMSVGTENGVGTTPTTTQDSGEP